MINTKDCKTTLACERHVFDQMVKFIGREYN